ncbi:MAG: cysteine hydrolase family protein [Spirulina sp. SIO3F2]|nr:cysteine hydrolase family protein [Spirulina sp. SIO3F2]
MHPAQTALILVGYQNDYFGETGLLHQVVEESSKVNNVIANTISLLTHLPSSLLIISTPINFTPNYEELVNPVGILKTIKEVGALQANTYGSEMIKPLVPFRERIIDVHGKRGFNAFAHTNLDHLLKQKGVEHVVIAGTITSICIDSTGRCAHELGYQVSILSDCTASRTIFEQEFYCQHIFPAYADVLTHQEFLGCFAVAA